MSNFKTEQIANFSLALVTAFELLQEYRENQKGKCKDLEYTSTAVWKFCFLYQVIIVF